MTLSPAMIAALDQASEAVRPAVAQVLAYYLELTKGGMPEKEAATIARDYHGISLSQAAQESLIETQHRLDLQNAVSMAMLAKQVTTTNENGVPNTLTDWLTSNGVNLHDFSEWVTEFSKSKKTHG